MNIIISKKWNALLILVIILLIIFILYFSKILLVIPALKPKITTQLLNKCSNQKMLTTTLSKPNVVEDYRIGIKILHSDYSFLFPYSDWKTIVNNTNEFEEPIRFPKVLYSLRFSFPNQDENSLFLSKDNIALADFTVSPDYCVSVGEWFSKIPNSKQYDKAYRTYNNAKWLIAKRTDKLPVYQFAMMHANGYHYEFNFLIRDKKSAESYKQLMDQVLSSFYIQKKQ